MIEINVNYKDRFRLASTSKGNQIKWYQNGCYIKADTMGYESIAEALVSELLCYTNLSFVDYKLCRIHEGGREYLGCICKNFLSEGESVVTVYSLLKAYYGNRKIKTDYNSVCAVLQEITGSAVRNYMNELILLDSIILNEDRHYNNIAYIRGVSGGYRPAPIFDNGLSLLSDTLEYPLRAKIESMIRQVKARPFNTTFENQLKHVRGEYLLIDTKSFLAKVDGLQVPFKQEEFERALRVLKYRLRVLESVVWKQA